MAATGTHATTEEPLEGVFSMRYVLMLYNEGQLPLEQSLETALRRVGGWCEMVASVGVALYSGVGWLVSE
jgi:hypothetical protein